MRGEPKGRIKRAIKLGLVSGRIAGESLPDDGYSSAELASDGLTSEDWSFELRSAGEKIADVIDSRTGTSIRVYDPSVRAFYGVIPPEKIADATEVSLVAIRGDEHCTLDSAVVNPLLGEVDGIYPNGTLSGWALPRNGAPRALAVYVGGEQAGTALADRYHPEFPLTIVGFVGFSCRIPANYLVPKFERKILDIRDLDTGDCLFSKVFREIPGLTAPFGGVLPIDAVVPAEIDQVVDDDGMEYYFAANGAREFVRMAYAYVLERTADRGGLDAFTSDLAEGRIKPGDLARSMLQSDERRQRGAFLGPFVGDDSYPFRHRAEAAFRQKGKVPQIILENPVLREPSSLTQRIDGIEAALAELLRRGPAQVSEPSRSIDVRPVRRGIADRIASLLGGTWLGRSRTRSILASADAARDKRDWHSARELYSEVVASEPGRLDVWVQYGHALKETGSLTEAEACYRSAISLNSSVADTHLQLGHVLKLQGKLPEARDAYRTATILSGPGDPAGRHAAGELASLS